MNLKEGLHKVTRVKSSTHFQPIHGLLCASRLKILDDRGGVFKVLAKNDPEFQQFGELYLSQVRPGAIKAWKLHHRMTLNLYVISGDVLFVFYDDRQSSPTYQKLMEVRVRGEDPLGTLIVVPPGVWSGFQGRGSTASILLNCASIPHDPEEASRLDSKSDVIPYQWSAHHD